MKTVDARKKNNHPSHTVTRANHGVHTKMLCSFEKSYVNFSANTYSGVPYSIPQHV